MPNWRHAANPRRRGSKGWIVRRGVANARKLKKRKGSKKLDQNPGCIVTICFVCVGLLLGIMAACSAI